MAPLFGFEAGGEKMVESQHVVAFHTLIETYGWRAMGYVSLGDEEFPVYARGDAPTLGLVALQALAHQGSTVNPRKKLMLLHTRWVAWGSGARDGVWTPNFAEFHSFRTPAGALHYVQDLRVN